LSDGPEPGTGGPECPDGLDTAGAPLADYVIAIDTVDAGTGDRVLVLDEGNGARQVVASKDAPVRSVIVGVVDAVTVL